MGYVDVPIILLAVAIVIIGQTFLSTQSKKRRALAAIAQKNQYFQKLQVDSQRMISEVDERIQELELNNDKIKAELERLGLNPNHYSDSESADDLMKAKSVLEQKKVQLESLDRELAEICSQAKLEDDIPYEDLARKIEQLQSDNKALELRLESQDKLVLPTRDTDMDPDIMEYLRQKGSKYTTEQLDALYEKLLEEKVADPNRSLEAYEARISTFDYEAEHQRLDVERKRVEKIYEREKRLYLEDAKAFNEARIEYCFKIPAVSEEYNARKELNDTDEGLLRNCRKETDLKPIMPNKSWSEDLENHYS